MTSIRRFSSRLLGAALGLAVTWTGSSTALAQSDYPAELRLDWGYYSPHTLLIKNKGWLEEAFKDVGTRVSWVQSRGSNNSLEFLKVGATDFAGSAGLSAFIARANGVPLKIINVASWGSGSLIQVLPDSPIRTVADLKGKQVAATKGTGPFFTLVRALAANGLTTDDIKVVHLQHPEGFAALQQKQVDAWTGIEPHTSIAEIGGARTIFHDPSWRDPSVFSTSEDFLAKHPKAVEKVLQVWADTQKWIRENPDEFAGFVAEQTQTSLDITKLGLTRRDWTDPVPGEGVLVSVRNVLPLIDDEGILRPNTDAEAVLSGLLDPAPARRVLGQ